MSETRQDNNYEYFHHGDMMGEWLRRKWDEEKEEDNMYEPYVLEDGTVIGATT